jgi:hypothetical protein
MLSVKELIMPNRQTHLAFGAASGAAKAAWEVRNLPARQLVPEIIGGGFGGLSTSTLPDVLEPAVHSWHRSVAHAGSSGIIGTLAIQQKIAKWQDLCRSEANRHDYLSAAAQDDWARFWHSVIAFVLRVASGILAGLPAGYASHLVLDAMSPRSIPLFG